jgi:hypothetical protein
VRLDPTTRLVHLERKDCHCGDGTQNGRGPCPKCKGTGRRGNGNCRNCYGSGTIVSTDAPRDTCYACKGNWQSVEEENWCDRIPSDIVQSLPHYVIRSNHRQTFVEAYIGVGLWSCTDYGRAWDSTAPGASDDEGDALIASVIDDETYVQATKVCRKTDDPKVLTLCDAIVIQVHPSGYNVVPYYGDLSVLAAEEVSA